jgi:multiple sugar transport system substrate-binding protein
LLLNNIDNTFVTPVFNGSASLRDAAGQLIENVAKSVRRKQTVDEDYMQKLYTDVSALYRLDQIQQNGTVRRQFDKLPTLSVILLISLAVTWVFIGIYAIYQAKKRK